MTYGLKDGHRRTMRPKWGKLPFDVIAWRIDSDTPYIIVKGENFEHNLTDTQAHDLVEMLNRALSILPSSK